MSVNIWLVIIIKMDLGNCQGVVGNFMNFMVVIITVVMCVIWTDRGL